MPFPPTPSLYHKDLGLKTEQILQNKAIQLAYNIHCTEHKSKREVHETYEITEVTEKLHNRYSRNY